jgi:hypothetical protein
MKRAYRITARERLDNARNAEVAKYFGARAVESIKHPEKDATVFVIFIGNTIAAVEIDSEFDHGPPSVLAGHIAISAIDMREKMRAHEGGSVTDEKFDRFARKLFGPEPSPNLLPLKAHEWRIEVAAASKVWTTLGLMWHEGKLSFEPREEK